MFNTDLRSSDWMAIIVLLLLHIVAMSVGSYFSGQVMRVVFALLVVLYLCILIYAIIGFKLSKKNNQ